MEHAAEQNAVTQEVTAQIRIRTGFTFDAAATTNTKESNVSGEEARTSNLIDYTQDGLTEDNMLVIHLYYTRNTYPVTYHYSTANQWNDGTEPNLSTVTIGGASTDNPTSYKYGQSVTVADVLSDSTNKYTFHGWNTGSIPLDTAAAFEMPAHAVDFVGYFTTNQNSYTVQHYLYTEENLSDAVLQTADTGHYAGSVGDPAVAGWLTYNGYTKTKAFINDQEANDAAAQTTVTSTISTIGSTLVIKLYYQANDYKVTYTLTGDVPAGVTVPDAETYQTTKTVTVQKLSGIPAGYIFSGWTPDGTDVVIGSDNKFTMPARNVVLTGKLAAGDSNYSVKHWLQVPEGTAGAEELPGTGKYYFPAAAADLRTEDSDFTNPQIFEAKAGTNVIAKALNFRGYTEATLNNHIPYDGFVGAKWEEGSTTPPDGHLTLNRYYDAHTNNVIYRYVGTVPAGAPSLAGYNKTNVRAGAVVDIEAPVTAPGGYIFSGWTPNVAFADGKFIMPEHIVYVDGYFTYDVPDIYTVTYFIDGEVYRQYTLAEGTAHYIIDKPVLPFLSFSVPVTTSRTSSAIRTTPFVPMLTLPVPKLQRSSSVCSPIPAASPAGQSKTTSPTYPLTTGSTTRFPRWRTQASSTVTKTVPSVRTLPLPVRNLSRLPFPSTELSAVKDPISRTLTVTGQKNTSSKPSPADSSKGTKMTHSVPTRRSPVPKR